jgi:SAM-dependent methyltransferase
MADGDWFRDYFDERVLALYQARMDPQETRGEVAGILELLGLPVGSRVLDVGCGWGRHAVPLAEAGMEVTGMDISATALREAHRAADGAGVRVRWVEGDMREIHFAREFDAALSLFSSLGYFLSDEDDLRVLRGIHHALKPGGALLLETMHRASFEAEFCPLERWDDHDGDTVEVTRTFDRASGINRERLTWPDGVEKEHAMRIRSREEWEVLLAAAGFRIRETLGGWDDEPFTPAAPLLLVRATASP